MAQIDDPKKANRLARAIASDLSLYNEEKVKLGLENDNFFEILTEEIAEGREHYVSKVAPHFNEDGTFERALVDVILARKGHVKSRIW